MVEKLIMIYMWVNQTDIERRIHRLTISYTHEETDFLGYEQQHLIVGVSTQTHGQIQQMVLH